MPIPPSTPPSSWRSARFQCLCCCNTAETRSHVGRLTVFWLTVLRDQCPSVWNRSCCRSGARITEGNRDEFCVSATSQLGNVDYLRWRVIKKNHDNHESIYLLICLLSWRVPFQPGSGMPHAEGLADRGPADTRLRRVTEAELGPEDHEDHHVGPVGEGEGGIRGGRRRQGRDGTDLRRGGGRAAFAAVSALALAVAMAVSSGAMRWKRRRWSATVLVPLLKISAPSRTSGRARSSFTRDRTAPYARRSACYLPRAARRTGGAQSRRCPEQASRQRWQAGLDCGMT